MLTNDELERYSRHFLIEGWDQACQLKLKNSTVFIAGAGGLGSPVSLYLAAAGVGRLIICDMDKVELSNLNRQILYTVDDLNLSKAERAGHRLNSLNPSTEIITLNKKIEDAVDAIKGADLILDCLDSFTSRLFLNSVSFKNRIPMVHAGVSGYYGQLTFIIPGTTPCLNCFISENTPQSSKGITGAMAGITGSMQAIEALKFLTGTGDLLAGKLLYIDCMTMRFNTMNMAKNPGCKTCSEK
ncbi:MAG TPA: HesA/MoeB/ThiF family protein [Spirochaetota bacterium]|nr:HesA/MoeB/ThiF family protein [Spirochaetota bacterium]